MVVDLDNFKNQLITYLNKKCPEIKVRLVGDPEYSKDFMLQIDEKSTDKAKFYEVNLVKYIKNEEFNQAKKDKKDLVQALKDFSPNKFIEDVIDIQPCTISPDQNGYYNKIQYSSISYSCFFEK